MSYYVTFFYFSKYCYECNYLSRYILHNVNIHTVGNLSYLFVNIGSNRVSSASIVLSVE